MSVKHLLTNGLKPEQDIKVNSISCNGAINMNGNVISNVGEAKEEDDVITKSYLDGLDAKTYPQLKNRYSFGNNLQALYYFDDFDNLAKDTNNNWNGEIKGTPELFARDSDGEEHPIILVTQGSNLIDLTQYLDTTQNEISVVGWFVTTENEIQRLFSVTDSTVASSDMTVFLTSGGLLRSQLRIDNAQQYPQLTSSSTYNDGQWHSFVAVWGSNGVKLFIDGGQPNGGETLEDGYTGCIPELTGANHMALLGGTDSGGIEQLFTGCVDRIAIFKSQLTEAQAGAFNDDVGNGLGYDIIPLMGQSNMIGRPTIVLGTDDDYYKTDGRVFQYSTNTTGIEKAENPLGFNGDNSGDMGLWRTFCISLLDAGQNRNILLVPGAQGGTGFSNNQWNQGDPLYTQVINDINTALAFNPLNGLVGCLWLQGEADNQSQANIDNYQTNFNNFISALETDMNEFNSETPFILCQVNNDTSVNLIEFNEILDAIGNSSDRFFTALAQGLPTIDGVHYDQPSLRLIGQRMADGLLPKIRDSTYDESALLSVKVANEEYLREVDANRYSGNVKANGYEDNTGSYAIINLGSFTANQTKQIVYPSANPDFEISFSSKPTQRVPYPDNINFTFEDFYNVSSNSFLENKKLGQGHLWRIRINISKSSGQNGGFGVRLYNALSGFQLQQVFNLTEGITDFSLEVLFYTIADDASLPSPVGSGQGYNLECSTYSGISLNSVVVDDITRISMATSSVIN